MSTTAPHSAGAGARYCSSANGVPEQINLQLASADSVVVSWITHEATAPQAPPVVELVASTPSASDATVRVTGVTHEHTTPDKDRVLYLHFVRLTQLLPRAKYSYTVQSGGDSSVPSKLFSFRAPYADGETRINIFGDMGIYQWNNMEWLEKDCAEGTAADAIVHMGDHACKNSTSFS